MGSGGGGGDNNNNNAQMQAQMDAMNLQAMQQQQAYQAQQDAFNKQQAADKQAVLDKANDAALQAQAAQQTGQTAQNIQAASQGNTGSFAGPSSMLQQLGRVNAMSNAGLPGFTGLPPAKGSATAPNQPVPGGFGAKVGQSNQIQSGGNNSPKFGGTNQ